LFSSAAIKTAGADRRVASGVPTQEETVSMMEIAFSVPDESCWCSEFNNMIMQGKKE
jgi:hypothetical protein